MENKNTKDIFSLGTFSKKVINATAIICIMLLCVFMFLKGFKVILLILSGILVAIFFRGLASIIQKRLKISDNFALGIAFTFFIVFCTLMIMFLAPRVSEQIDVLEEDLPKAAMEAKQKLEQTKLGGWSIRQFELYQSRYQKDNDKITLFFSSFFGGLADLYIIFFLGLFFMVQPNMYKNGVVLLFPKHMRLRAEQVLLTMGYTLRRWLMGKLLSMLVVGVLTGIGLFALGIPLTLTLAIFAALVTFIPNFGPIISLVPTFLIALSLGTNQAIYVCILYGGIQALESNIITPIIQQKMISFPLAMILIAQVILGIFTGTLGLMLAVPVTAILMVFVKMVYIEDILDDTSVEVKGENKIIKEAENSESSFQVEEDNDNKEVEITKVDSTN